MDSAEVIALVGKVQEGLSYKTAADILGLDMADVETELNDIDLRSFVVYISEKAHKERKECPSHL